MGSTRHSEFEQLYERSFDRVAAYVLARTDRDAAADAISRTFEIAWRRRADLPEDALPWLIGVARRVLSEGRRAERRRDALTERMTSVARHSAEDHVDAIATRDTLIDALSRLTAEQREALLLMAWDGLSEKQAAAALGCSRGALALRTHRARKQLRRHLAQEADRAVRDEAAAVHSSVYRSAEEAM